jgi:lysophospholipase L1-like esterase
MRIRVVATLAALLSVVVALVGAPGAAASGSPYYVALGDSLAAGIQPNASGENVLTSRGYANDLFAVYRLALPTLQLANLACPGETTQTMVAGGIAYCPYALGSQLAQAAAFLKSHRVALVTIDIGANDIDGCVGASGVDASCIAAGFASTAANLPGILATLRAAAGAGVPIVAMNYYDPFLAAWLQGAAGQALATQSEQVLLQFNSLLASVYGSFGIPVADVQSTFRTTDFAPLPLLGTPVNVSIVCAFTWMCASPPVGPNIHPNSLGYAAIAATFVRTIGRLGGIGDPRF